MKKFKDYCKRVTALFLVGATVLTSGCGQSLMDGLYADELSTELVEEVPDGTEDTDSADGVAEGTETDSVVAEETESIVPSESVGNESTGMSGEDTMQAEGTEVIVEPDEGTEEAAENIPPEETESVSTGDTELTETTETEETEPEDTESIMSEESEEAEETETSETEEPADEGYLYIDLEEGGSATYWAGSEGTSLEKVSGKVYAEDLKTGTKIDVSKNLVNGYYLAPVSPYSEVLLGVSADNRYIDDVGISYESGSKTSDTSFEDMPDGINMDAPSPTVSFATKVQLTDEAKFVDIDFGEPFEMAEPGTPVLGEDGILRDSGEIPAHILYQDSASVFAIAEDGEGGEGEPVVPTVSVGNAGAYGGTHLYTVASAEGTFYGFCCNADLGVPTGAYEEGPVDGSNPLILVAMLTAPIDGASPVGMYKDGQGSLTDAWAAAVIKHPAVDIVHYLACIWTAGSSLSGYYAAWGSEPEIINLQTEISAWYDNNAYLTEGCQFHKTKSVGGKQGITWLVWAEPPVAYLTLHKRPTAGYESIVEGNALYGKSATFNIAGEGVSMNVTTDDNGDVGPLRLKPGTYTVTEITPPTGFKLPSADGRPDSVDVTLVQNGNAEFTFNDTPYADPTGLILYKKDNQTGKESTSPQGDVDFSEARFTVKYYDNLEGKDEGDPKKTWVYWPDDLGIVEFMYEDYLDSDVSGNTLWKHPDGAPLFLAGTYVVTETVSPSGYKPNKGKYVAVLGYDNKWVWKSYPTTDDNKLIIEKKPDGTVTGGRIVNETKTTGLSFRKFAKATGGKPIKGTSFEGVQFYLYNMSESPIRYEYKDAAGEDKAKWVATAGHKLAVVIIQISQGCIS